MRMALNPPSPPTHSQIEKEDDKFSRICEQEIERYAADGKPLYPLYKALEQKPKEIMAVTGFRI